ncbi:TIGR01777 family oxidoreductase [Peribacillus alkalitolerans]|uniref:TIGR01777 family oxidoreductase n=1 Tax=Peribacillus alkalitolerans TaxID=1550385 RepID=UPI0013D00CA0|nr:TIGR01777 family oxidoreductase [Peribacillus alkalitolerans]
MKIAIAGGSGFVGKELTKLLTSQNHQVIILTRKQTNSNKPNVKFVKWLSTDSLPEVHLEGVDAIVNLAGESINSGRWNQERKKRILDSRISTTAEINRIIQSLVKKPDVLINASAIGWYGTSTIGTFTELHPTPGDDFLANTVNLWEEEAKKAEAYGIRVALMRFGIILGKDEGALPKMVLPYKMFAGGPIGQGNQWMSWIHLEDVARAIEFSILTKELKGPVNISGPKPVKMDEFGRTLGDVLHRPHWFPTPRILLRSVLGEMSILVLEGQKVIPEKLIQQSFIYKHPILKEALADLLT